MNKRKGNSKEGVEKEGVNERKWQRCEYLVK
jgi:hypothetical protein